MRSKIKYIVSMTIAMLLLCVNMMPLAVFAAGDTTLDGGAARRTSSDLYSTVTISGADISAVSTAFKNLESRYGDKSLSYSFTSGEIKVLGDDADGKTKISLFKYSNGSLEFYYENFESADNKAKKAVMSRFSKALTDAEVSATCRQNIANMMSDASSQVNSYLIGLAMDDSSADIFTAMKWLGPILQFVRIIIGCGVIIIIVFLIASTVMDCLYIGLPMWRNAQADKNGGSKPKGVSHEAISVVQEVESDTGGGGYKNAYWLYFKRRSITYLVLAICILYLIIGELGGLIQGLLNMVSGFAS